MNPLGADCGFPAGLGDAFRPGFWLWLGRWLLGLSVHSCGRGRRVEGFGGI